MNKLNIFLALTLVTFFTVQPAEGAKKDSKKFKCLTLGIACSTSPRRVKEKKAETTERLEELLKEGYSLPEIRKATIKHIENCPPLHLSTLLFFKEYGELNNLDF